MISTLPAAVELLAQGRGEPPVDLDGDHAPGLRGEPQGERAQARADFDYAVTLAEVEGVDDLPRPRCRR